MKNWYAGLSRYGIGVMFNSNSWECYAFDSKQERDTWVNDNYLSRDCSGNIVAQAITYKEALIITGATKNHPMVVAGAEKQHYPNAERIVKSEESFY